MKNDDTVHEHRRSSGIFMGGLGLLLLGLAALVYSLSYCVFTTIATRQHIPGQWVRVDDTITLPANDVVHDRDTQIREVVDFLIRAERNSNSTDGETQP